MGKTKKGKKTSKGILSKNRKAKGKAFFVKNTFEGVSHRREKNKIDKSVKQHALMAASAYTRGNKARQKRIDDILPNSGFKVDESLSNKRMMVVDNGKDVYVAFKGTDELSDIAPDLEIALGIEKHSKRFKQSNKEFQRVKEKYKGRDITLASHSLGGAINSYVYDNNKNDIKAVHNFNPGSSPLQAVGGIGSVSHSSFGFTAAMKGFRSLFTHPDKKVTSHHVVGDPISISSLLDRSKNIQIYSPVEGSSNSHTIEQFLL